MIDMIIFRILIECSEYDWNLIFSFILPAVYGKGNCGDGSYICMDFSVSLNFGNQKKAT